MEPSDKQNSSQPSDNYGVWELAPRPDRAKPFAIQYRKDGKRKTESFATEKERDRRATALRRMRKRGQSDPDPTAHELREWRAFQTAIGSTPWQDVVAAWRRAEPEETSPLVTEVVPGYLERLKASLSDATYRARKPTFLALAEAFRGKHLHEIRPADIEQWLGRLGSSPVSFNSRRARLRVFFKRYLKRNPCDEIERREDLKENVTVLPAEHARTLFAYAQANAPGMLGRLALEAFAGLRFSSAFRLEKRDINFADKGITLPKHKMKTKRRYYIDGLPDNLWAWLAIAGDEGWGYTAARYMHLKSALFEDAGVPHPRNVLRHSFCSYHIAAYKDAGRTAKILCHRDQQMLWSHYLGNATEADGKAYFAITPNAASG